MKTGRSVNLRCLQAAFFALSMVFALGAAAQAPGDLDLSFNAGSSVNSTIYAVARQSDGKWIVSGDFTTVPDAVRARVARLSADGSNDPSFMEGLAGANHTVHSVALQSDAKILIAGAFTKVNGEPRNGIARLNLDGTLDRSFGDGLEGAKGATLSFFIPRTQVLSVALQSDGKILIGGNFTEVNRQPRNGIARLNEDGTLDRSFGEGLSGIDQFSVLHIAVQSDGKILIGGGFTAVNEQDRPGIARLNQDGTLDNSFLGVTVVGVHSIALQDDGKILIGGQFNAVNGQPRNRIARLNPDGSLDTSFGSGLAGVNDVIYAVVPQSDGKILIGGEFRAVDEEPRDGIARLNADGTLDSSFASELTAAFYLGTNFRFHAISVQGDGKLLVGGFFTSINGEPRNWIARLNEDGTLDRSYPEVLPGPREVNSIAVQMEGKIIVGGAFTNLVSHNLARFEPDGTLDSSFGGDLDAVKGTPTGGPFPGMSRAIHSIALLPEGKILSGGRLVRIARLDSDGMLDDSFERVLSGIESIALLADDRILIGGWGRGINRLNPDGTLDDSFASGLDGVAAEFPSARVYSVALQNDGKILIGGEFTRVNGEPRNRIARLNEDGALDSSFGDGMEGANHTILALAVQSDGKIIIGGGFTAVNQQARSGIARLNPDGALDQSFGNGLSGADFPVHSVAIQSDGKILIGGLFSTIHGKARNGIARLNPDGRLDDCFGHGLAGADGVVRTIAVQDDGKILIGGIFTSVNGVARDGIARLLGHSADPKSGPVCLDVSATEEGSVLSWPADQPQVELWQTESMTEPVEWSVTARGKSLLDDRIVVRIPMSERAQFFRLLPSGTASE